MTFIPLDSGIAGVPCYHFSNIGNIIVFFIYRMVWTKNEVLLIEPPLSIPLRLELNRVKREQHDKRTVVSRVRLSLYDVYDVHMYSPPIKQNKWSQELFTGSIIIQLIHIKRLTEYSDPVYPFLWKRHTGWPQLQVDLPSIGNLLP